MGEQVVRLTVYSGAEGDLGRLAAHSGERI